MGGVTINVQVPVSDDRFPATDGRLRRVYIPSGIQHMNGAEALRYARSRHGSTDFDRGVRQQRVLLSLREQADPQALIPRLPQLSRRSRRRSRPTSRSTSSRRSWGSPRRSTPRTSARTCSRRRSTRRNSCPARAATSSSPTSPGSGPRSRTPSPPTRPTRRPRQALAEEARRGLGPQRHQRQRTAGRASPASSTTTAWPPRRHDSGRPARSRPTRRSSSTTAPRRSYPATIAYLEKTLRRDGHDRGRPRHPDRHHRHRREGDPRSRGAAPCPEPRPTRSG